MMRPRSDADAGYTLIELVVSLLLLSFVMLAVTGGVRFGAQVWDRSQRDLMTAVMADRSQDILRGILSHAMPRLQGEYVTFSGEPSRLEFDCVPPRAFDGNGTAHAILSIAQAGSGIRLILRLRSIIDRRAEKTAVLADDLSGAQFSYLDASGKKPIWLSYWRDRDKLPDAVRISTDSRSIPQWPALVIRPIISQDPNCTLDPVSLKCRKI